MLLNKSVNTKAMKENNKNTEAAILEAADKLSRRMDSRGLRPRWLPVRQAWPMPCDTIIFARKSRSMSPRSLQCRGGQKSSPTPIRSAISLTQCVPSIWKAAPSRHCPQSCRTRKPIDVRMSKHFQEILCKFAVRKTENQWSLFLSAFWHLWSVISFMER